jgi:hypothetical protein
VGSVRGRIADPDHRLNRLLSKASIRFAWRANFWFFRAAYLQGGNELFPPKSRLLFLKARNELLKGVLGLSGSPALGLASGPPGGLLGGAA